MCAEILGFEEEKPGEYLITGFHIGKLVSNLFLSFSFFFLLIFNFKWFRTVDLTKIASLFPGLTATTGPDYVKVVTNEAEKRGFDIFKYGSLVFYNTPRQEQKVTTAKLLGLEVDPSNAPYQLEGYDNYETLLEVRFFFSVWKIEFFFLL